MSNKLLFRKLNEAISTPVKKDILVISNDDENSMIFGDLLEDISQLISYPATINEDWKDNYIEYIKQQNKVQAEFDAKRRYREMSSKELKRLTKDELRKSNKQKKADMKNTVDNKLFDEYDRRFKDINKDALDIKKDLAKTDHSSEKYEKLLFAMDELYSRLQRLNADPTMRNIPDNYKRSELLVMSRDQLNAAFKDLH